MVSRRGWLLGAAGWAFARELLGSSPVQDGVHRVRGEANVNGTPAMPGRRIASGDRVATGRGAELVFVVGADAFLMRADSQLELLQSGLRIATGAVLSVFQPGSAREIRTPTAAIGVRGTALYIQIEPGRTYVCTCYGVAELEAAEDPGARETVRTEHHDQPRYVMAKGAPQMIMSAPVVNHTDAELTFLENLVGRAPAFAGKGYRPY